jgi:hypothetical protein
MFDAMSVQDVAAAVGFVLSLAAGIIVGLLS